jgi:hypothetical protein
LIIVFQLNDNFFLRKLAKIADKLIVTLTPELKLLFAARNSFESVRVLRAIWRESIEIFGAMWPGAYPTKHNVPILHIFEMLSHKYV